jgi:hypothetical protein
MTDEQKKIQIMYKDTNSPGCIPIGCKSFNERNCSDYTKAFETVKDNNAGDTTYTNTTCGEKLNWYNNNTDMTDEQKKIQIMYKDTNSPGCIPIGCKSFNERN